MKVIAASYLYRVELDLESVAIKSWMDTICDHEDDIVAAAIKDINTEPLDVLDKRVQMVVVRFYKEDSLGTEWGDYAAMTAEEVAAGHYEDDANIEAQIWVEVNRRVEFL